MIMAAEGGCDLGTLGVRKERELFSCIPFANSEKKRHLLRRAPGGERGPNFKKQSLAAVAVGALTQNVQKRHCTAWLDTKPPASMVLLLSKLPHEGVSGILFQPTGPKFALSGQSYTTLAKVTLV